MRIRTVSEKDKNQKKVKAKKDNIANKGNMFFNSAGDGYK